MADVDDTAQHDLPAGDFSSWLSELQRALRGERSSDVPCDGCTACCKSSQFIHIAPDEADTLAHVPGELLFPAPGLPDGHVLMGYDERGHCPMLIDDRCSIYEHRPRTCRTYDCRVLPAAGLELDDERKALISRRARRWRFSFPGDDDRNGHEAVRAAARFLGEHQAEFGSGEIPSDPTQLAVLAIEAHDTFLRRDDEGRRTVVVSPDIDDVRAVVIRLRGPRAASNEAMSFFVALRRHDSSSSSATRSGSARASTTFTPLSCFPHHSSSNTSGASATHARTSPSSTKIRTWSPSTGAVAKIFLPMRNDVRSK